MSKIKYSLLAIAVFVVFAGCEKEEDMLEGIWERVNVEDINAGFTEEWHMFDGELIVKEVNNSDPDNINIVDNGRFRLKPVFNKTYLSLQFNDPVIVAYDADWEVLKLTADQLIIVHDVYGGITKREFIKK